MPGRRLLIRKCESGYGSRKVCVIEEDSPDLSWIAGYNVPRRRARGSCRHLIVKLADGDDYCENMNFHFHAAAAKRVEKREFCGKDVNGIAEYLAVQRSDFDDGNACFVAEGLKKVMADNENILGNIRLLDRRLDYAKRQENKRYSCNMCDRVFVHETGLRRHYLKHNSADISSGPGISVWQCPECFKVWPSRQLMLNHVNECCFGGFGEARDTKVSVVLKCEFCENVFISVLSLLQHTRTHVASANYTCSPCDVVFADYRRALGHWRACSWIRTRSSFAVRKMLLCGICDLKFAGYNELYTHRYKTKHFPMKRYWYQTEDDENQVSTIEITIFQCELCDLVFTTVPKLIGHRNTH